MIFKQSVQFLVETPIHILSCPEHKVCSTFRFTIQGVFFPPLSLICPQMAKQATQVSLRCLKVVHSDSPGDRCQNQVLDEPNLRFRGYCPPPLQFWPPMAILDTQVCLRCLKVVPNDSQCPKTWGQTPKRSIQHFLYQSYDLGGDLPPPPFWPQMAILATQVSLWCLKVVPNDSPCPKSCGQTPK